MTGSDAIVKLGDKMLAQVNSINCSLAENVLPIYGVWSYTYDTLAIGTRIVQGVFTINFVSPNYIIQELEALTSSEHIDEEFSDQGGVPQDLNLTTDEGREFLVAHITDLIIRGELLNAQRLQRDQIRLIHGQPLTANPTEVSVFKNKHGEPGSNLLTIEYTSTNGSMSKIIEGVAIAGCSQLVDMSGRTVMEEYQFIGRDMKFNK